VISPETITQVPARGADPDALACQFCTPEPRFIFGRQVATVHGEGCPAEVACRHCDSEVRLRGFRFRVIHAAGCPWWQPGKHGRVPCGYVVTHRGPYARHLSLVNAGDSR
jgi:hypothetical protein